MSDKRFLSQKEAVLQSKENFEKSLKEPWSLRGATTGHYGLDMTIGGWLPNKLTTLTGRSGHGKSMMINNMLINSAGRVSGGKLPVYMIFSWEMPPYELIDRALCQMTGINSEMMTLGSKLLTPFEKEKIAKSREKLLSKPIKWETVTVDVKTVVAMFTDFVEKTLKHDWGEGITPIPVGVLDNVNMNNFESQTLSPSYTLTRFMYDLKNMINTLPAHFCVLAQTRREQDDKKHTKYPWPSIRDLSDSKGIENASDVVCMLFNPVHVGLFDMVDPLTQDIIDTIDASGVRKLLMNVAKNRSMRGTKFYWMNCKQDCFEIWDPAHSPGYDFIKQYESVDFWKNQRLAPYMNQTF